MRCPICKAEGKPHTLTEQRIVPLYPQQPRVERFYDEDDKLHVHDHETRVFVYSCSNGHNFRNDIRSRCVNPGCDWNRLPQVRNATKTLEEIYKEQNPT